MGHRNSAALDRDGSHRSAASVRTTPRRGLATLGGAHSRLRPACGSHKSAKITLGRQRYRTAQSKIKSS